MACPRDEGDNWLADEQKPKRKAPAPPSIPVGSNNRTHIRFGLDGASARVSRSGLLSFLGLGESRAGAVSNLSEGGVRLVCDVPLAKGQKVKVRIEMEKYQDVFEAVGQVRWCSRNPHGSDEHLVGIQFTALSAAQARKLAKMREWFTSPEYKAKRAARSKGSLDIEFPR